MGKKEERIINEAESFIKTVEAPSGYIEHFEKLLKEFKKLDRRVEKIIRMNDRFEKTLNVFNDSLVTDKKERGKRIIEQKQKILQSHQEEKDELQSVIKQREEEVAYYKAIIEENKNLKESNRSLEKKAKSKDVLKEDIDNILEQHNLTEETIQKGLNKIIFEITDSGQLNFNEISTDQFEKNHLYVLQNAIFRWLKTIIEDAKDVLVTLANYILREHYELLHKKIAAHILEGIQQKNRNYERFIREYSGDVFIAPDRQRYKRQEIIDLENNKWNITAIINLMYQFSKDESDYKAKQLIFDKYTEELYDLGSKSHSIENLLEEKSNELEDLIFELSKLDRAISDERKELQKLRASSKMEEATTLETAIKESVKEQTKKHSEMKQREKECNALEVKQIEHNKRINYLETEIQKITLVKDKLETKFNTTKNKYVILLNAVTAVLMKRKTRV